MSGINKIKSFFTVKRPPDFQVEDYLDRWWIIPRNKYFNIYLHKFIASDDDRAFHDHPWYSVSFLLSGEITEHSYNRVRFIPRFFPVFRSAKFAHRLEVVKCPVWTLFMTGPNMRNWGFYAPEGWMFWQKYIEKYGTKVSKKCGDHRTDIYGCNNCTLCHQEYSCGACMAGAPCYELCDCDEETWTDALYDEEDLANVE